MGKPSRRLRAPAVALLTTAMLLGSATTALADPGDPDSTFGDGGGTSTDFAGDFDSALDVLVQSNGRPVAVGQAITGESFEDSDFAIARYLTFGDPDSTFSGDGRRTVDFIGTGDVAEAVAIQENGRIVVAGSSNDLDHTRRFAVARVKAGGALDHAFSGDGRVRTQFPGFVAAAAHDVAVQGNG